MATYASAIMMIIAFITWLFAKGIDGDRGCRVILALEAMLIRRRPISLYLRK